MAVDRMADKWQLAMLTTSWKNLATLTMKNSRHPAFICDPAWKLDSIRRTLYKTNLLYLHEHESSEHFTIDMFFK